MHTFIASTKQKQSMLHALRFGLACDPERAGFEGGVTPYEVPGFSPEEMAPYASTKPAPDPAKRKGTK